jgi:hypothetical protein
VVVVAAVMVWVVVVVAVVVMVVAAIAVAATSVVAVVVIIDQGSEGLNIYTTRNQSCTPYSLNSTYINYLSNKCIGTFNIWPCKLLPKYFYLQHKSI